MPFMSHPPGVGERGERVECGFSAVPAAHCGLAGALSGWAKV